MVFWNFRIRPNLREIFTGGLRAGSVRSYMKMGTSMRGIGSTIKFTETEPNRRAELNITVNLRMVRKMGQEKFNSQMEVLTTGSFTRTICTGTELLPGRRAASTKGTSITTR